MIMQLVSHFGPYNRAQRRARHVCVPPTLPIIKSLCCEVEERRSCSLWLFHYQCVPKDPGKKEGFKCMCFGGEVLVDAAYIRPKTSGCSERQYMTKVNAHMRNIIHLIQQSIQYQTRIHSIPSNKI